MDDERNGAPFITQALRTFAVIFSLAVLSMSLAGTLLARYAPDTKDVSSIFVLAGAGLPYGAIMQIAAFALIMSIFCILIFSDWLVAKTRFLWRFFLLFLATLFTASAFAVIFKWFPADSRIAWLGFLLATVISFTVSSCLTLLKIKLEGKKYDKLLARFKSRKK